MAANLFSSVHSRSLEGSQNTLMHFRDKAAACQDIQIRIYNSSFSTSPLTLVLHFFPLYQLFEYPHLQKKQLFYSSFRR